MTPEKFLALRGTNLYMGIGRTLNAVDDADMQEQLEDLEADCEWIAEEKNDGQWAYCVVINGKPEFYDRYGNRVNFMGDFRGDSLGDGVIIGEMSRGTEYMVAERKRRGYDFFCVHDMLVERSEDMRTWQGKNRHEALKRWYFALGIKAKRRFPINPQWTFDFCGHYRAAHEGLVLKHKDAGPYVAGKSMDWIKAKKSETSDMILMGCAMSDAPSKQGHAKHVVCGQFMGDLPWPKALVEVPVNGEWAQKFGENFDLYWGDVVAVKHLGRTASGSCRSPSLVVECGDAIRTDKRAADCTWEG